MELAADSAPRILILEADAKTRATVLRYVVKGLAGASVQCVSGSLEDMLADGARLRSFDVLLVGCDFSSNGASDHPTLRALRAIGSDPENPAVILLTRKGSEFTAVQAIKSGAFDYLPKDLLGRAQILSAVQRAVLHRGNVLGVREHVPGALRFFGYDMRRCLAQRENVSVHVAFSAERCKEVVLKVLHRGSGSMAQDDNFARFVDEFKLLHDIDDPAVAEIYDFRVTTQYCYIAMEYFPLGHLGGQLGRALSTLEALRYTTEIAHSLAIIHGAGIVHRDLKPGNIMLRENGTVALIDFGISQRAGATPDAESLESGAAVAGTPYYISPEQARGEPTDERTDLYALGVIFYHMLTGEKVYVAATAQEILDLHCSAPLPQLPSEHAALQPLLDRLLAKNRAQRVANARELIEAIESSTAAVAASAAATTLTPPPLTITAASG